MKSDVILVHSEGNKIEKALDLAERVAVFKRLSRKSAMHLRLLTEEMMGMMHSLTGERIGEFWIEDDDGVFHLHLAVETLMDSEKRRQLLEASTEGKNEAAKGIMGRIRDFFDGGAEADAVYAAAPLMLCGLESAGAHALGDLDWSLALCRTNLMKPEQQNSEAWDELEKSVVSHVADDIRVSIRGDQVEMIIDKRMA